MPFDTEMYRIQMCIVMGVSENGTQAAESAPRTRSREATRGRLLDAAAEVFAEVGLGAASVEAVCERAGFTRGAFYSNFATKDELFLELASRFARERTAAVHERIAAYDGDIESVDLLVQVLSAVGDDRFGALLMTEITAHALRDESFAAMLRDEQAHLVDEIADMIREVAARGELRLSRHLVPAEAARILLAAWNDVTQRAAIERLDVEAMTELRVADMARIVRLIIE